MDYHGLTNFLQTTANNTRAEVFINATSKTIVHSIVKVKNYASTKNIFLHIKKFNKIIYIQLAK
jgi:hypothetical protein